MRFTLRPYQRFPMHCAVTYNIGPFLKLPMAYFSGFWLLITLLVLSSGPAYAERVVLGSSDSEVAIYCEQSIVGLKRRPEEFMPKWRSVLNLLRKQEYGHDLWNLFTLWGRIPADGGITGKDLIHEATFTLSCLEKKGELRMEKLGTAKRYWGEDFENQMIIFTNP